MLLALAIRLHESGDYVGAQKQCKAALALADVSESLTADLWDVLGSAQRDAGDLAAGRFSYGRALEIRQRLFGNESAQVATTLSNLGVLEHRAGRNVEAIDLLSPAVLLLIKAHGEIHPEVARAAVNLGIAHTAAGDLDLARTIFQFAVNAFQTTVGEAHPDFARSITGLGTVYLLSGDRHQARRLLARAVRIFSATLGPRHPQTVMARAKLVEAAGAAEL
jgi:tetratricopeptide (TPR) repeat protein